MSFSKHDFMTESDRIPARGGVSKATAWAPPDQPSAQGQSRAAPERSTTPVNYCPWYPLWPPCPVCLGLVVFFLTLYLTGTLSGSTALGVGAYLLGCVVFIVRSRIPYDKMGADPDPDCVIPALLGNGFCNALACFGICQLLPDWPMPALTAMCLAVFPLGQWCFLQLALFEEEDTLLWVLLWVLPLYVAVPLTVIEVGVFIAGLVRFVAGLW